LTKLESGEFKLNNQPRDIINFMKIMISLFSSLAEGRGIKIKHNLPEKELWLLFDRDALEKIFFNILSNAIKFSKENSTVELNVNFNKNLCVSISDNGPGIPKNEQEKIFDRFYQAKNNYNTGT